MRRLFDISVEEISFCDRPANLEKGFQIIKNDDKPKWDSVQRILRGYSDSDLELLDDAVVETMPIQKASSGDNFPSITYQIDLNEQKLGDFLNEIDIDSEVDDD